MEPVHTPSSSPPPDADATRALGSLVLGLCLVALAGLNQARLHGEAESTIEAQAAPSTGERPQSTSDPRPGDADRSGESPLSAAAMALQRGEKLDLNKASVDDFVLLPRIGPALARRILELRTERKRFRNVEELRDVRGIGQATLERIRPLVRVGDDTQVAAE